MPIAEQAAQPRGVLAVHSEQADQDGDLGVLDPAGDELGEDALFFGQVVDDVIVGERRPGIVPVLTGVTVALGRVRKCDS